MLVETQGCGGCVNSIVMLRYFSISRQSYSHRRELQIVCILTTLINKKEHNLSNLWSKSIFDQIDKELMKSPILSQFRMKRSCHEIVLPDSHHFLILSHS